MTDDNDPTPTEVDSDRLGTDATRRAFLKTAAGGALVAAAGVGTIGGASAGIPTPWLSRDGNLIKDPNGNKVILRGVNVADPRRLNATAPARGKDAAGVIDLATNAQRGWHSRVVRLPVQPGDIAGLTPIPNASEQVYMPPTFTREQLVEYCENHLDPAVQHCKERGAYAIVDYHRHWGNGSLEWTNDALDEEVRMFWDVVAPRYAGMDHVIFEMYNEPTAPLMGENPTVNQWSADRWRLWKETAQPWLDVIRSYGDNFTIIGSPSWSQYPEGALVEEFDGGNLGYTYHIYPGHSITECQCWDTNNGNGQGVSQAYKEVPLFVTEFGWQTDGAYPTIGTTDNYGKPFTDWIDANPIHWTAWCFDPTWLSAMFEYESGDAPADAVGDPYNNEIPEQDLGAWVPRDGQDMGQFIKDLLASRRNDDLPEAGERTPTETTDTPTNTATDTPTDTPTDTQSRSGPNWPAAETGTEATDPDDDGLYEDLTGNGEIDNQDVVRFFNNMGTQSDPGPMAAEGNLRYYDYSGNEAIDYQDLITLFGEIG